MKQINLIPWREQARKQRKREFFNIMAVTTLACLLLLSIIHFILASAVSKQNNINTIYQQEINRFNQQLAIIDQVKKQQTAIVERIDIIDKLQATRSQVVNIFSDIVKTLPQGVYLTSMKRVGDTITLTGKAESNTRISMFMRNLEPLTWIAQVSLSQIQTQLVASAYNNNFVLELQVKSLQIVDVASKTAKRE